MPQTFRGGFVVDLGRCACRGDPSPGRYDPETGNPTRTGVAPKPRSSRATSRAPRRWGDRLRRRARRDGRDPNRAFPLLHEPLLPRRVGREHRATAVLRVEDGCAERDERVGHIVVWRLRVARAVAAREGDEPEVHVELDACGGTRGDAETHSFVGPRLVAREPHRAQRRARVDLDDLASAATAWKRQHAVVVRLPQLREQHIPQERHLERRLELVLQRRLTTGGDVRRPLRPEPRALGPVSPRGEGREVERVAEREALRDPPVEGAPAEERAVVVAEVRGELRVA